MGKGILEKKIGVVGLGLMGSSIVTSLLLNKNKVVALSPISNELDNAAPERVKTSIAECVSEGFTFADAEDLMSMVEYTTKYEDLADCEIIMECVVEDLAIKKKVYLEIEKVISSSAILTSNTSAIPISVLQSYVQHPARFFGMHWAEPAYTTKFLEIICGEKSDIDIGKYLQEEATKWGKEPTLVKKDIRGFITNRLMYAMYREAFYLVENGYASVEDVDRACKNDAGYWITFCGPFRYMDLTGVKAYHAVMSELFADLDDRKDTPRLISDIVERGGNGTSNYSGFYQYTPEQAKAWERNFEKFAFDIHRLAQKYSQMNGTISEKD